MALSRSTAASTTTAHGRTRERASAAGRRTHVDNTRVCSARRTAGGDRRHQATTSRTRRDAQGRLVAGKA
jgi:hypothetical protein